MLQSDTGSYFKTFDVTARSADSKTKADMNVMSMCTEVNSHCCTSTKNGQKCDFLCNIRCSYSMKSLLNCDYGAWMSEFKSKTIR